MPIHPASTLLSKVVQATCYAFSAVRLGAMFVAIHLSWQCTTRDLRSHGAESQWTHKASQALRVVEYARSVACWDDFSQLRPVDGRQARMTAASRLQVPGNM